MKNYTKPLNRLCKPKQMCSRFSRAVAEKKHWSCCDLILLFWFGWEDEKGQHELKRTTSNDIYSYKRYTLLSWHSKVIYIQKY